MKANGTYIRVLASALSTQWGVKVEEGETWKFNLSDKTLTYNPITLLEKPIDYVRGYLMHEIGHIIHSELSEGSQIYKDYPAISLIYNAMEDLRIEEKLLNSYGAFVANPLEIKTLDALARLFTEGKLQQMSKVYQVGVVAMLVGFNHSRLSVYSIGIGYEEKKLRHHLEVAQSRLKQYLDPEVVQACGVIEQKEVWDRLVTQARARGSFAEVQKLVDQCIFPHIKHLLEQDPLNEQMKKQMQEAAAAAQDSGVEKEAGQGVEITATEVDEAGTGTRATSRRSQRVPDYVEASSLVSPYVNYLGARIKDIMKETEAINFHGNHRSGRLLSRNVTKLTMGEERVFSKRNRIDSPKHHLVVALDGSGSMCDDNKVVNAYLGTVLAVNTFKRIKMDFTVLEFSDDIRFLASTTNVSPEFLQYRLHGGDTDDAKMIDHVASFMKARPSEQFLFMVIGDGYGEHLPEDSLEYIAGRGVAMGIGIGNGSQQVAKQYPNGVYVEDVTKVPQVILNVLHKYIYR